MKRFLPLFLCLMAAIPGARADIAVAVVGPMTGPYAAMGEQMRHGAGRAVDDLNASGGVLGERLRLVVGDDACEPKQAVAVANKLVADRVAFVAGHLCSNASIPAAAIYQEEGVIQISPASTSPRLTDEGGPFVFRVCGRDDQQGPAAAAFIAARFADARIAVIHDKTAYGRGLAGATVAGLAERGIRPILEDGFTAGEKDYSALVTRLKEEAPDLIYAGARYTEVGLILRQAAEQGWRPRVMAGDALAAAEFWKIAGESGEGALFTFQPDPRLRADAAPVVERLRGNGFEPEAYTLYTYGAVEAWGRAARRAGSISAEKVAAELRAAPLKTVLGDLSFDRRGDVEAPGFIVYRWSEGTYGPIE